MMANGNAFRLVAALGPLLFAAACTPAKTKPSAMLSTESATGTLTYWCSDGGSLRVERVSDGVRIAGADTPGVELPAAPSGQDSRYSEAPYTLVLDGKDALFMKNGREPLACTR
jgi:hypothetical protein